MEGALPTAARPSAILAHAPCQRHAHAFLSPSHERCGDSRRSPNARGEQRWRRRRCEDPQWLPPLRVNGRVTSPAGTGVAAW